MRISALSAVCSGLALAVLPIFLVAGLAPQVRDDLALSETEIGVAITTAFIVGALSAVPVGRLADRLGVNSAVFIGATLSIVSLAGIGALANTLGVLIVFLATAGLAMAFTDTGFAILITSVFPQEKRGLAFGVKEAAIPAATLAVGVAIPTLALTLGWRWAVAVGVVPLVGLILTFPRIGSRGLVETHSLPDQSPSNKRVLIARPIGAATAAAFGTAAATGVSVFLTQTVVNRGLSPGAAGALLTGASIAGLVTRIAMGRRIDRRAGNVVGTISLLMLIGSAAMALGAIGQSRLLVLAAIGVFAGGAGWSGLLLFALVESRPEAAGAAAGVGVAGLAIGSAIGPVAFGLTIEHASLTVAWAGAAVIIGLGALLMTTVGRRPRMA